MKIYPKKLKGIKDLQKEKKILLKRQRELDEEGFFSLQGLTGKPKEGGKDETSGDDNSLLGFLPVSNPLVATVLKIVQQRFFRSGPEKKTRYHESGESEKPKHGIPYRLAKEFIGGYLKWKAIEFSIKGIRYIIKTRREKNKEHNY